MAGAASPPVSTTGASPVTAVRNWRIFRTDVLLEQGLSERAYGADMREVDRYEIMLMFALTECRRALDTFAEMDELIGVREKVQPGVELFEMSRIFDHIRLGLQMAANVSKIFWPPDKPSSEVKLRCNHLRSLTGLPVAHGLTSRTLRNHVEHIDERLDRWTRNSPRPFLNTELVFYDDYRPENVRAEIIEATLITFEVKSQTVHILGEQFSLPQLRADLEEVLDQISKSLRTNHTNSGASD